MTAFVVSLPMALIYPRDGGRRVRNECVAPLAESMSAIGLRTPITVRPCQKMKDCAPIDAYEIVAGQHRYHAALKLQWTEIDCFVADEDVLRTELIEIDENLMRAELSPAEEAAYLRRRKEIWEALNEGGTICSTPGGPQRVQFAKDSAEKSGRTKQDINRSIRRAEQLGEDIERVKGTSLDKGVELDALVKLPEKKRAELIGRAEAGEVISARPSAKKSEPEPPALEGDDPEWSADDEAAYAAMEDAPESVRRQWVLDNSTFCRLVLGEHGHL